MDSVWSGNPDEVCTQSVEGDGVWVVVVVMEVRFDICIPPSSGGTNCKKHTQINKHLKYIKKQKTKQKT